MRTLLIIVCFCFSSLLNATSKTQLTYSVSGSGNYFPYYTHDNTHPGILPEAVSAILKTANIEGINLLLPAKRTILYLQEGKVDFDLISPSWLTKEQKEDPRYVFSNAIISVDEYIVSSKKMKQPIVLHGQNIGTVRGYYYHNDHKFERIDFNSEKELVQALARGRIEYAIIGDLPTLYWAHKLGVKMFFTQIHSKGKLHMRLQAKHHTLLSRINQAIDKLHAKKHFEAITLHYVQTLPNTGAVYD